MDQIENIVSSFDQARITLTRAYAYKIAARLDCEALTSRVPSVGTDESSKQRKITDKIRSETLIPEASLYYLVVRDLGPGYCCTHHVCDRLGEGKTAG